MSQIGWNLEQTYTELPELFYSHVEPNPVKDPQLVFLNGSLAQQLGLDPYVLQSDEGVQQLAGNVLPEGADPIAQAYAGHQFGSFTMLGDGRAHLLGEHVTGDGSRYDIQLKGAGATPYSRGGDGRAALGPMLREYMISEALYGLGVPTNRSLAVTITGESIQRDAPEIGAVLTRVAKSHIRVGTFQYARQFGSYDDLKGLADYALERHFTGYEEADNRYLFLLHEVVKRQAKTISQWQLVGFVHGVMNTDNMTISGESIDYGPCAFMNTYNQETVFSSIDFYGRYKYGNQPKIAAWNLARFAETLLLLIGDEDDETLGKAENVVHQFFDYYQDEWMKGMRRKLGLQTSQAGDETLIDELLTLMKDHEADFTNTFRDLTLGKFDESTWFGTEDFKAWYQKWQARLESEDATNEQIKAVMKRANPSVIPRNHQVEAAIQAADEEGDLSVMDDLLRVLADPYAYSEAQEAYTDPPEESDDDFVTYCGT
ncbi:protein adenylyltransferase SelO [Alkalibacillus sp. S2W]|uniref:protein adenylyltransferase SelO n=1 Tax=Alkalibacillus sp. S2W TaxID=3386553 RepID=UPI00398C90D4